jgi:hypothetical protein
MDAMQQQDNAAGAETKDLNEACVELFPSSMPYKHGIIIIFLIFSFLHMFFLFS